MKIENYEAIENIYNRIQEILSIERQFLSQLEPKIHKETNLEFLQELKKTKKQEETNSTPVLENQTSPSPNTQASELPKHTKPKILSKDYLSQIIEKEAQKKGLDPDLVKAIIKAESNFNPKAVSPKGAQGLMQLMPSTAEDLGIKDPFDPIQNIKGGTSYLKELSRIFRNRDHIIAAYNAGPATVKKYGGIPPYSETQTYVRKVNEFLENLKED